MAKKGKIDKKWWIAIIPGIIAIAIIVFILALLVIKLLWGWVVQPIPRGSSSGAYSFNNWMVHSFQDSNCDRIVEHTI